MNPDAPKPRTLVWLKRGAGWFALVLVIASLFVLTLAGCFVLGPWPFLLLAAFFYIASRLLKRRTVRPEPTIQPSITG